MCVCNWLSGSRVNFEAFMELRLQKVEAATVLIVLCYAASIAGSKLSTGVTTRVVCPLRLISQPKVQLVVCSYLMWVSGCLRALCACA